MSVTVVIPIFNESENIELMYRELANVMRELPYDYDLLFIDDGSTDGSGQQLAELATRVPEVRLIRFRRNFGQTAALQAGIEHAMGEIIVTIDGDLQNDPRDIPRMLEKIEEGYDLIHGWRRDRQDAWLHRILPSLVANALISRVTGQRIHDLGCALKVMRKSIADDLELYGQMHRFISVLAAQRGARCLEMVTNHRARQYGQSKYGLSRTIQVLLDLCTVKYMQDYFSNPMKLFGRLALGSATLGMFSLFAVVAMKIVGGLDMTGNPLLLLGVFCLLASTQLLSLGLLGEVSARLYYTREGHRPFAIAEKVGYPSESTLDIRDEARAA